VTDWDGGNNSPDYSPDGSTIVWSSAGGAEAQMQASLFYNLMDADGKQQTWQSMI